jgi:16S rRNA (uracil1498-N3)-methyltransferase
VRRFFVEQGPGGDGRLTITGADARHISRVLRLAQGDVIEAVDGSGREFRIVIDSVGDARVVGTVASEIARSAALPGIELVLIQGLPKGDKMDFIVQKGTELGVARFMPVLTARSVARPEPDAARRRAERWSRIAAEAAKQCGMGRAPRVEGILSLSDALAAFAAGGAAGGGMRSKARSALLFPWELATGTGLREALTRCDLRGIERLGVVIGPEGGFDGEEAAEIIGSGGIPLSLGTRILRTETAGLVVAAVVMYELGELG